MCPAHFNRFPACCRDKIPPFYKERVICKTSVLYITLLQITIPQCKILCPQHITLAIHFFSSFTAAAIPQCHILLLLSDRYFQSLPQLLNGLLGKRCGFHNKCIIFSHFYQIARHFRNATFYPSFHAALHPAFLKHIG